MTGSSRNDASNPPSPGQSAEAAPTENEAEQPKATRLFMLGFPLRSEAKPSLRSLQACGGRCVMSEDEEARVMRLCMPYDSREIFVPWIITHQ